MYQLEFQRRCCVVVNHYGVHINVRFYFRGESHIDFLNIIDFLLNGKTKKEENK